MNKTSESLEQKIIISGVMDVLDPKRHVSEIKLLIGQGPDWVVFIKKVIEEKIAPIIYYNFKKQGLLDLFPDYVIESFVEQFFLFQRHHFIIENLMGEIFKDLAKDMDIIVLKGAVLTETVYGGLGIRGFTDVDLLIREKDLVRLEKVLIEKYGMSCDFVCPITRSYYTGPNSKFDLGNFAIDVIWEIVPVDRFGFAIGWKTDSAWEASKKINIYGQAVRTLSFEDMILYQVYHLAFHHKFTGLLWYVDLLKIIQQEKDRLNWDKIIYNANVYGISGVTYNILSFVKDRLNAPILSTHLDKLKSQTSHFSLRQLARFNIIDEASSRSGFRDELLAPFIFDRPYQAIKVFYRLLFPSWRWLRVNFGKTAPEKEYKKIKKISLRVYWWFLYLGWSLKQFFTNRKIGNKIKTDKNL